MEKIIPQLFIYVSVFGITDNILKYFNVSTKNKIILYILLLVITLKYIK